MLWLSLAAAAKSRQSFLTLCDPTDGCPPGSPVPGILQARTLEWVATSFSNAWKWKVKVKLLSHAQLSLGDTLIFWGTISVTTEGFCTRRASQELPGKRHNDAVLCVVTQTLFETPRTIARQAPPATAIFQARILGWVAMPSSRRSPQPGDRTWSPTLQADSLPSEPPGKPNDYSSLQQSPQHGSRIA